MTNNEKALLDTIAFSELGEALLKESNDGYNILVGSKPNGRSMYLQDYNDHPRILVQSCNSTAAGRYQILVKIYDYYKKILGLKDFSPDSQDAIALHLIKERKALSLINDGKFEETIDKIKKVWASLPGAGYGQREHNLQVLKEVYLKAGGTISG